MGKGEAATTTTGPSERPEAACAVVHCYSSARRLPAKARSALRLRAVGAGQVSRDLVGSLVTAPHRTAPHRVYVTGEERPARDASLPRGEASNLHQGGWGQSASWPVEEGAMATTARGGRFLRGDRRGRALRCPGGGGRGTGWEARRGQKARSSSFAMVRQGRYGEAARGRRCTCPAALREKIWAGGRCVRSLGWGRLG
jgi:hypothetical protein